jgi:hypothetical protein
MPAATWQANMRVIIDDAQSWPVDVIILEEIGVRTDKAEAGIGLIREYNAGRSGLLGAKVVLGTARTLQNQQDHMETLSRDRIHQTDVGQLLLVSTQAAEVVGLFGEVAPAGAKVGAATAPAGQR